MNGHYGEARDYDMLNPTWNTCKTYRRIAHPGTDTLCENDKGNNSHLFDEIIDTLMNPQIIKSGLPADAITWIRCGLLACPAVIGNV